MLPFLAAAPAAKDLPERLIETSDQNVADRAREQLFFREFALHMARQATREFGRARDALPDGAAAVEQYLRHEADQHRLRPGEVTMQGHGFRIQARAHACPYRESCRNNLTDLGEVPQCVRAITLIQAIGARVPGRPPMTYDLKPGLVDGTSSACEMSLRPALLTDLEPVHPAARRA